MKNHAGAGVDEKGSKAIVASFVANMRLAARDPEVAKRANLALSRAALHDARPRNVPLEYARANGPYQERSGRKRTPPPERASKAQRLRAGIESGMIQVPGAEKLLETIYRAENGDGAAQAKVAEYLKNAAVAAVLDAFL